MILEGYPIIRCDGKFDILFYDIKGEIFPDKHGLSCLAEISIRSSMNNLSSFIFALLPTLKVESVTMSGESLIYKQDGTALEISLKEPLQKGEERTISIDYKGELIAIEAGGYYDGYIGEEGVFMRTFAGWYPYCVTGPECYLFADVPYILEIKAPLDWTLFAHPESPEIKEESGYVEYRWDGRQVNQRIPYWGIVLIGGKYQKIERNADGQSLTFFCFDSKDKRIERLIDYISDLLARIDEICNVPTVSRNVRVAETASFISPTYQPLHTAFYSNARFDYPKNMAFLLTWDDIMEWQKLSTVDWEDPLLFDLGIHLHRLLLSSRHDTPKGWLRADLEKFSRGYLGTIQRSSQPLRWELQVDSTKGPWVWWMWHQIVCDKAFSQALKRLRTGVFPDGAVISPREFFSLTSDESGLPVDWFWNQWMERTSAPQITFSQVTVKERQDDFLVEATIHQPGDFYILPLEIMLRTTNGEICQSIFMTERNYKLALRCKDEPVEIEIDPDGKIMKIPQNRTFRPIDLGFEIAFCGGRHGGSIPIRDEVLRHGKRIAIVPSELMDVFHELRPYLEKRTDYPKGMINSDPDIYRNGMIPIPVELHSPDEVTGEVLKDNNIVLIGTPQNNHLIEQMATSKMVFSSNKISAGEAVIENTEQSLIAFGENPQNAERFCLLVTALSNEALRQPPDFTEMPGDYLIYHNGKPVKVGYQEPYRCIFRKEKLQRL